MRKMLKNVLRIIKCILRLRYPTTFNLFKLHENVFILKQFCFPKTNISNKDADQQSARVK